MGIIRYIYGNINGDSSLRSEPARDFEKAAKLSRIAGSYIFPGNKSAQAYEHWVSSFCSFHEANTPGQLHLLQKTWNNLVELNPALQIIQPGNSHTLLRHAIFGTSSLFNPDDTYFFIEMHKRTDCSSTALLVHEIPAYEALHLQIRMRTTVHLEWVASPPTLRSIFEQIKNRPAQYKAEKEFYYGSNDVTDAHIQSATNFIGSHYGLTQ